MQFDLFPYGKPFNLLLSIQTPCALKLRLTVFDPLTKRIFSDRRLRLDKSRTVLVKLPIVSEQLRVSLQNEHLQNGITPFKLEQIKVVADTKCPLELSDADKNFIRFAKWFSIEVDKLGAGEKGTLYQSEGFTILYLDTIKDGVLELTTPARIARESGVIEVSKKAIKDYTVPMLIVMLLHEYAHKFKNPEYGKKVENELTADLIACNIALNLGFDPLEVENCFRAVFSKKNTDLNRRRIKAIMDFITLFIKNEPKRCNTRNHANRPK